MHNHLVSLVLLSGLFAACSASSADVSSPDGNLDFALSVADGKSVISIAYKGETLLLDSPVGIDFEDGFFGDDVRLKAVKRSTVVDEYDMPVGKTSHVRSVSNGAVATLADSQGRMVELHMRAFDDGVAYRYVIPSQEKMQRLAVRAERMELNLAGDPVAKAMVLPGFQCSHEALYKTASVSEYEDGLYMDMPVFVSFPTGRYMAVTEASVLDYAGMMMVSEGGRLTGKLSPRLDGSGLSVIGDLPHRSPWRVFLVSDRAGALLESNILTTLCDPCTETDLSWLKPGKSTWPWWCGYQTPEGMKKGSLNTVNYNWNRYYIDFCSDNGITYNSITGIVDENGREYPWYYNEGSSPGAPGEVDDTRYLCPGFEIVPICEYAEKKGVDMRVWVHWKSLDKDIEGSFRQFSEWGIKGMMIDFMDRDDAPMVDFYTDCAKMGAKYHMMCDFHGAFKPTGLQRTYPNVINYEGIYGQENMKWNAECDQVTYDVTLPYIRFFAGPADYTQGAMRNANRDNYRAVWDEAMSQGTRCHQLAMYVVFSSPLNMLCDAPTNYLNEKECTQFIAEVPEVWDETISLDGKVAEYSVIARRSGDTWYIGALGNWDERDIDIKCDFLPDGDYSVTVFQDGVNANKVARDYKKLTKDLCKCKKLHAHLASGGGYVAVITKK